MSERIVLRLSLWYAAAVGSVAMVPYLAVILADTGMRNEAVALSLAVLPIGNLVGAPLWSFVADRTGSPRLMLMAAAAGSLLAASGLLFASSAGWLAVGMFAYSLCKAPMFPLGDALAVRALPGGSRQYGQVRLWGSIAFLLLALLAGTLRETWPKAPIVLAMLAITATFFLSATLPAVARVPLTPAHVALKQLAANPSLRPLLAVGVLHGISLTAYDSLYSLHIEGIGLPSRVVGWAVATGVLCESLLMAFAPRLLDRISLRTMLLVGVAAGVPRFWLTGVLADPFAQVALQSLQALSFGAYWIAAVALYGRLAPSGLEGATQSLLPASTFGAGYLIAMVAGATLLEPLGSQGFFQMLSGVSALATLVVLAVPKTKKGGPEPSLAPTPEIP